MKLAYIFERKEQTDKTSPSAQDIFEKMFESLFSNVLHNCFEINLNNELFTINYTYSGTNNDIYYLTLSLDSTTPSKSAKVLDYVDKQLQKGSHRKDFYIILSYDGASEYYCEKLAPRFGKFERLMREFIYITLTKSLGAKWFHTVFTKEQQDELKKTSNIHNSSELIEQVLYEMTFAQLYEFLFQEFSYVTPEHAIYEQLLTLDLENTDKNTIIRIIQSCRKTTLWKEFFSSNEFDLSSYLENMRKYRNKVAHNKFISFDEYNICTKSLRTINTHLSNAINIFDLNMYTQEKLNDLHIAIASALDLLVKNNTELMKSIRNSISVLSKVFESSVKPLMENIGHLTSAYQQLKPSAPLQLTSAYQQLKPLAPLQLTSAFNSTPKLKSSGISIKSTGAAIKGAGATIKDTGITLPKTNMSPDGINSYTKSDKSSTFSDSIFPDSKSSSKDSN